ncbi:unnamed protein product [Toxocara canis]|uniref:PUM-HD domain-containing protein n=1 Tax=Toxocara canis TaxID=6265 RepID=A0A183V4C0_TOXCA|nr:unnamed protein product [Toxocara canis]
MAVSTGRLGSAINSMVLVTPSVQQNGNFLHSLENLIESGDVAELAKTKQGCFLLQQNVPLCDQRLRAKLYNAFLQKDVFYTLCGDPSGNFFMQKLMDRSSPVEHPVIVSLVQGYLTALSCNRYSTRVMQKLWLKLNDELRMVLLDELKGREIDIAVDPNGTHLIQRIIEGAPISIYGPIVETFVSTNVRLRTIAEGRSGRRIVQLVFQKLGNDILLPHSEDAKALLEKLMQGMMLNFEQFVNHQFANYVIQYIISAQVFTRYTTEAIKKLFGKLLILSQEKYASHVVERALEFGNTKVVGAIMDEIFNGYEHDSDGADALEILLFDQFGNYVVQKMFEIAIDVRVGKRDGSTYWFDVLAQRIHQRYHQLRKYSSGLRLIGRLASVSTFSYGLIGI